MDKINLVIPQFHTITRSFTQKVNLANHVKERSYESVDFFASHNEAIPLEEADLKKIKEVSDRLYDLAKQDVEEAIENYIRALKGEAGVPTDINAKDLVKIKELVVEVDDITTKTKLQAAKEKATKLKPDLNENQLNYLARLFRKAEAKVL